MADGGEVQSQNCSRRGSFSITTASELNPELNDINSTINDSEITSMANDQMSMNDTASMYQGNQHVSSQQAPQPMGPTGKFKLNATPFFIPSKPQQKATAEMAPKADPTPKDQQSKGALASSLMNSGLDSLTIDNEFTPSTPYVHKFRTELCKNWQLYGKCKWGDEVSTK